MVSFAVSIFHHYVCTYPRGFVYLLRAACLHAQQDFSHLLCCAVAHCVVCPAAQGDVKTTDGEEAVQ